MFRGDVQNRQHRVVTLQQVDHRVWHVLLHRGVRPAQVQLVLNFLRFQVPLQSSPHHLLRFLLLRCLQPRHHLHRLNPNQRLLPPPRSDGGVDQPHPGSYMPGHAPVLRLPQKETEASPGSALYHVSSATPPSPTYQVVVKAPLFPPVIELTPSYHNWEQFLQPEIRITDNIIDRELKRTSRYLCQRTCRATKYFSNP